ncbi:hypothetical protein HSB1_21070 [Halogranum salarium B-1]|uniref:Uncharacterized protein n=1 Tax=Halogranum salarium B-1 TaxID=1210908 RepID=J3JGA1_9EURY|nr:hypothetical protein HSB1_21070 [Halogranum salarium B-1]
MVLHPVRGDENVFCVIRHCTPIYSTKSYNTTSQGIVRLSYRLADIVAADSWRRKRETQTHRSSITAV